MLKGEKCIEIYCFEWLHIVTGSLLELDTIHHFINGLERRKSHWNLLVSVVAMVLKEGWTVLHNIQLTSEPILMFLGEGKAVLHYTVNTKGLSLVT